MPNPQDIFQLAQQTATQVTASPENWRRFLYTAAHNYHTTYLNQLLIHAQRPDATACATMKYWNEQAHRKVMYGSKSIIILQRHQGVPTAKRVFSMTDTVLTGDKAAAPWEVTDAIRPLLMQVNSVGSLMDRATEQVVSLSDRANRVMANSIEDSTLGWSHPEDQRFILQEVAAQSTLYMICIRLGIPVQEEDFPAFQNVTQFDTSRISLCLGGYVQAAAEPLLKRQAAKASAGETSSSTPLQNTTVPTETQVTRKTRFRRKAIQQQAIKAKAPQRVQNLMPKENQPLPDRKQVLRKQVILIKAVRKKLAEREARRAATHSMPTPKLPRTSSKPVREQLQRLANYLLGKLKQLLAHAASAVVNALIYLVGAGGVVLILALVIGAAAAILGSPMGILFADESGDPNSIPIGEIVLEANTEFGETISDLVTNHPECSNVEFHYEYEDGHTWSSYWPEVLAVFAVNQNLNGDDDVIVIDREKADLLIDTFWMMHRIESEVEEVVLPADSGDGSEESEDTETQTEYILHITVTSVPVDDLAHDLSFTDDQMDILHQLLSDEMRPMLVQMCGTGTSTGTVPPVVDGSMIWPLPGHTSLTTHFGEADAFGNPGHRGIDIPAPEGTPILAAHSGTVLICGWNDSFGNQVLIDDGAGLSTRYAHMTATAVSPGAVVTAGQVIGYVGSTGDSTGNHLHFEVSVGGTLADPLEYVLPQ